MYTGRHRCVCLSGQNETTKIASESVKTDTLISIPAFRMSAKIVAPTDQIICHCCCSLQKDAANCYYHSNPPPPLGGFHSSPITSSNDSNLSPRTCGLSKNGRDMWEKSDAIAAIRSRGISAPRVIHKHANASHAGVGGVAAEISCSRSNVTICSFAQGYNVHYATIERVHLTTESVPCGVCPGSPGFILWNHRSSSPCGVDLPAGGAWSSGGVALVEV